MKNFPLQPNSTPALVNHDPACIDLYLPRILDSWPWPRHVNPHYDSVQQASSWGESFQAFSPKVQNTFNKVKISLLAALAYPELDRAGYRVGCDLMSLFLCIEDHTDLATADVARFQASIIMDALRHPHKPRPSGEWVIGEMARQWWANATQIVGKAAQSRFINSFQTYLDAVVQQADDRAKGRVRSIEDYFRVRRETVGAKPAFAIGELYWNIPQEAIDHPVILKLTEICVDLIIISNDIYSYKKEWERHDEDHNLVTVVMQQFGTDVQGAINYIGILHGRLVDHFFEQSRLIPVFGDPLDAEIRAYYNMLGNWVRANDSWSFESERYFGKKGPEIQADLIVRLTRSRGEKRVG